MGNKPTKPELTADEQWMEKNHPGSGYISSNRWRNPHKLNCAAWKGIGNPAPVQQLGQCLKEEIEKSKGKKRGRRMLEYVSFFVPWQEESKRREEKRKEKQSKQAKTAPTETANPPPYKPPPSAPEAEQPKPPTLCSATSHNPFPNSDPYASVKRQLNLMKNRDTPTPGFLPPLFPHTLGQYPLVQMPNPNYGRPTGPLAAEGEEPQRDQDAFTYVYQPWTAEDRKHVLKDVPPLSEGHQQWRDAVELIRQNWLLNGQEMIQVLQDLLGLKFASVRGDFTGIGDDREFLRNDALQAALQPVYERIRTILAPRPDYAKIGKTRQKENETASDFLDRLCPVFRQNSGLEYTEGPETPYQQQLKNAFLKGLLPKVRAHVDKHWVTQNTGNLPDALQYAEHAVKVQKNKAAQSGVFVVTTEGEIVAYAGRNPQKGKGRKQNKDDKERHRRCYNCDKEGHFARDCRSRQRDNRRDRDRDREDREGDRDRDRDRDDRSNRRQRQGRDNRDSEDEM